MIIDSHAHYSRYNFEEYFRYLSIQNDDYCICEGTRTPLMAELRKKRIEAVIEASVDMAANEKMLQFAAEHKGYVFPAIGVHPTRTSLAKWHERKQLPELAKQYDLVAIGETGLDYHQQRRQQHRMCQLFWFVYQICLADKLGLPLVLHVRDAHKDALRVLKLYRRKLHGGVVHCFCSTREIAAQYASLGLYIGIGGALLQGENSIQLQKAVKDYPMDRILVETDAPFVLPDFDCGLSRKQRRKIRNTSLILPKVIEKIAELKDMDPKEAEAVIYANTMRAFALDQHGFSERNTVEEET